MPRDSPEKNTPRRLFGNSAGYSADSVVACVLPKKMQGGHSVEYQYYLRQIYRKDGSVWIDILEAAQAEKLGYQTVTSTRRMTALFTSTGLTARLP